MLEALDSSGTYIVIAIVVLAIASLLGLVLFASKEETFEDVVAAQKKEQEALLNSLQSGNKSGKVNKKWNKLKHKKANKKENDEADPESGFDDDESIAQSQPIIEEPVVVKVQEESLKQKVEEPKKSKKSSKKASKELDGDHRDNLKNKKKSKERAIVEDEVVTVTEQNVVEAGVSYPDVEEEVVPTEVKGFHAEVEAPAKEKSKGSKSKKEKSKKKENSLSNVDKVISDIENADMESLEIQAIIDLLLAKQNEQEQWKKPNQKADPLEQLKKLLQEKELQLAEGQQTIQNAANKNKELRSSMKYWLLLPIALSIALFMCGNINIPNTGNWKLCDDGQLKGELQQERTQRQSIQAQANIYAEQAKEQETIRKRSEEQHFLEKQSMETQIQRLQELVDGASHSEVRQLKEENSLLKNASMRAQQLAEDKNSLVNELNQLQQSNKQLRQELDNSLLSFKQAEQTSKGLKDEVNVFKNQIQSVQRSKTETENALTSRLHGANDQIIKLEGENQAFKQELEASKKQQASLKGANDQIIKLESENQALKQELEVSKKQKNEVEVLQQASSNANKELGEVKSQLSDKTLQVTELESSLQQLRHHMEQKDLDLKKAQADVHEITVKLEEAKTAVAATPEVPVDTEELAKLKADLANKEQEVKELNLKLAAMENDAEKCSEIDSHKEKLEIDLAEFKEKTTKQQEALERLKEKNNELREKNWKAMDAISGVEKERDNKINSMEKSIYKGLKQLHPSLKIPKSDDKNIDILFENYSKSFIAHTKEEKDKFDTEMAGLKDQIIQLTDELETLKNNPPQLEETADKEEILRLETEKTHLKSVLSETETMLERLKAGVDAEVAKWQKKVEEKDNELQQLNLKVAELENTLKEQAADKQLGAQAEDKINNLEAELGELKKQSEKSQSELDDVNAKLKKTISERDLLIREFKELKETSSNTELNLKKMNDDQLKAAKKLLDQIKALENTAKTTGKGDEEKDKIIKELYVEIEELKQELKDEKDRVVIDIETPDTKVKNLEAKLQEAEKRVKELEASQSQQIESQIHDAMQQATVNGMGSST